MVRCAFKQYCKHTPGSADRRGTILIMVVGILAMLFIIGSTLLIVARFERTTVQSYAAGRTLTGAGNAVADPILEQLRQDAVGQTSLSAWDSGEPSPIEDWEDIPGWDGLLSSIEPYGIVPTSSTPRGKVFAFSSGSDNAPKRGAFTIGITGGPTRSMQGEVWADADGDGIRDNDNDGVLSNLANMFGASFTMQSRVVPHGGMVLLDPLTHPSLLMQVIHPQDNPSKQLPVSLLWTGANSLWLSPEGATDSVKTSLESLLRRRFMLPSSLGKDDRGNEVVASGLPATDIRNKLQVTLGYTAPAGADASFKSVTPHYWPVDDEVAPEDQKWWALRLTPPDKSPAQAGYNASRDLYDRRRLVTTVSSDDLLRRQRDEQNLSWLSSDAQGVPRDPATNVMREMFYSILQPPQSANGDATSPTPYRLEDWGYVNTGRPWHYGRDAAGVLRFNVPELRTQFSLRDVLEDPTQNPGTDALGNTVGFQASYRKVMQLTSYFLAMIQHTTVPNSAVDESAATHALYTSDAGREHLLTAMQLAVNAVDFADNGDSDGDGTVDMSDPFSFFEWPQGGAVNSIRILGVEKQPYITEIYAKMGGMFTEGEPDETPLDSLALYAVELYNPYSTDIDLTGILLGINPTLTIDLGAELAAKNGGDPFMPAYSYLVIANRHADTPATGNNPPFVTGNTTVLVPAAPALPANAKWFQAGSSVQLIVSNTRIFNLFSGEIGSVDPVVIDEIDPGKAQVQTLAANATTNPGTLQGRDHFAELLVRDLGTPVDGATYWRHTSIQRQKEAATSGLVVPIDWRFTLGLYVGVESAIYSDIDGAAAHPPVHGILDANVNSNLHDDDDVVLADPIFSGSASAVAAFPVLVADRGITPSPTNASAPGTAGTLAFPTTGSLLLVTRYAHLPPQNGVATPVPVSLAAMQPVKISGGTARSGEEQIRVIDNGHMPIVDGQQTTKDGGHSRLANNVPWGQLVYDYFTALPLEELIRPLDLSAFGLPAATLIDTAAASEANYRRVYSAMFPNYPLVDWVAGAPSPLGARVLGRINLNVAPWWVLDGLPVIRDDRPAVAAPAVEFFDSLAAGLPVAELGISADLIYGGSGGFGPQDLNTDPFLPDYAASGKHDRVGQILLGLLRDVPGTSGSWLVNANMSHAMAKYVACYREKRAVNDPTVAEWLSTLPSGPEFVSTGRLFDVLRRIPLTVKTLADNGQTTTLSNVLESLRDHHYYTDSSDPTTRVMPYSYLGYLQLVAPMVRLQDWVTVKNHVFTVYAGIGDESVDPALWLRTQTTVDRTRCLYSNDLPLRITHTPLIGYYNSLND